IQGIAEKIGKVESLTYFNSRPLASRIGAWISEQSKVISSRKVLDMKYQEAKYLINNGEVPLPKTWGGFRVSALNYEFWQGREHRLHDRFRYRLLKTEGRKPRWCIERLAP
ncbi:MAG: pyridoxine 5'-phosphate oxidase C-terminal domain-containing protein, partial [SAR86 cluster bacterium]|nr:pyridoxine 5'-phosphate oxidase C-terminal domain-containing protein [SAR86 cluster bacterium]